MSGPLFSSSWYRVAALKPRLRAHARIHRHVYRGQPWYVLEDTVNQKVHRFTPATHAVIGLMDGRRTTQEIFEIATETLGDDAPTQDELIRLLGQLHGADVLQSDVPPDTAELLDRYQKGERQLLQSRLLSPLALKIPLLDPDRWLARLVPFVRPLMGPLGVALWLAVVLPALFMVGAHWSELTEGVLDRLLVPRNLLLIWLVFPVIKALHELGHGITTRYFGGEVHDMGLMFLVFAPVPYVDASSASAFPRKHQRALVAGAGMIVEVFLAALAFYVWLSVEPGAVRTLAYNAMLIAGVTTLTFNANPLLRFDGYYILADLIEVPNLRQRANAYVGWLFERFALGNRDAEPPDTRGTEPVWLTVFAVASFVYRFVIIGLILLFVFDLSLVLGTVLALVSAVGWVAMPLVKGFRALTGPRVRGRKGRTTGVIAGAAVALLLAVTLLPLPYRTQAEGVIWIPEESLVRAQTRGFIERIAATPGSTVGPGDLLFEGRDPDLDAAAAVLEARLDGLRARHTAARVDDLAGARVLAEEISHVERRLARARERLSQLAVRAASGGTFVVPDAPDLPGRFVDQGELLGYVVAIDHPKVRAVVSQEDIELVRHRLRGVRVRRSEQPGEQPGEDLEARLSRLPPSASDQIPSPALGTAGGGPIAIDPSCDCGTVSVLPVFQVELDLPGLAGATTMGGRVHVRFDHGFEPLASRWYRGLRQLFLARLDV
jgi:putative peptide zinc metalloprotease protein